MLKVADLRRKGKTAGGENAGDRAFRLLTTFLAASVIILLIAVAVLLFLDARLAIGKFGLSFITTSEWDPVAERFGALPYIYGTLVTSALALVIAGPIGVGAALFLAEYAPGWLRGPVAFTVELLAVIPSIIYGLWGLFVLAPVMRGFVEPFLRASFGGIPVVGGLFSGPILGRDLLIGGVILAIMILPTVTAISREVILAVPDTQREGMIALGATKWETIKGAVLPYARAGVVGALVLGLARALGETMAVTMVIGNSSTAITGSLFTPGYTMASALANQFNEADSEMYFSAIVEVALVLLLVATVVNIAARLLVWGVSKGPSGSVRA
ncbi:MAG: phosphate ABC transporter permease subunit PstC [Chloroflexota bacterium]